MAEIAPIYLLSSQKDLSWSETQEKLISNEYPFVSFAEETPEQYVVRTYLQFLWLPESIMPLNLLVPSMLRVKVPTTSNPSTSLVPHPLHALLEPLMMTARAASTKYSVELSKILTDGGGAGEVEEAMMWYALNYQKVDGDGATEDPEMPWTDEKWKITWLRRMERREVQIQILLHLLVLSLPGPTPELPKMSSVKRRKLRKADTPKPPPSTETRLEGFMDKLSTWQLMGDLDAPGRNHDDDLDWIQAFCRDTVEPQFDTQLPDPCTLLRTKVFPSSPFSDAETEVSSRSSSPPPKKRARSKEPSRHPSPAPSATSTTSRTLDRSRSRSLSVSLAQERERERAQSAAVPTKRRVLNREISMSRGFKPKAKPNASADNPKTEKVPVAHPKEQAVTLVTATPAKSRVLSRSTSQIGDTISQGPPPTRASAFVASTPTKSRVLARSATQTSNIQPQVPENTQPMSLVLSRVGEEEEMWNLPTSSPDILLLTGRIGSADLSDLSELSEDEDDTTDTPSRKPRRGR